MEGSDYGEKEESISDKLLKYVGLLIFIGIPILAIFSVLVYSVVRLYRRITNRRYKKDVFGKDKIDGWNRDVPFGGNPSALYSLIQNGDHLCPDKKKAFTNVVSAYFLK